MKALRFLISVLLSASLSQADEAYIPGQAVSGTFDSIGLDFLEYHCFDCHDDATAEADLNLMELGAIDETNAATWKSVWAQIALQEMPPKKKEQPEVIERLQFTDWIIQELEKTMADKGGFHAHRDPGKANFLDHDLLFGPLPEGIQLQPTSSPKRIWRITPSEHITRLNEFINTEPKYNSEFPGLRTHGDAVSINHGGELKLYFGVDRIIDWSGGTVAYATAVKAIPVVLSPARPHGLKNYANFSTVNSAEATQILSKANDILKYMAYGPLSLAKYPEQITDDPAEYWEAVTRGDDRGLPSSITYNTKTIRPLTPLYHLLKEQKKAFTDEQLRPVIEHLFEMLTFRPIKPDEAEHYLSLLKDTIQKIGPEDGLFTGLSAIFLDRDALFRAELAEQGIADKSGRVMLQDWELGLALNHSLSYLKPDPSLRQAIAEGKMRTRADVKREVTRMLTDESIRKPRVLQFFREYFDYDLAGKICKDEAALNKTGAAFNSAAMRRSMHIASASTDRLVELILAKDHEVLKELLTTQKLVLTKNDATFYGQQLSDKKSRRLSTEERRAQRLAAEQLREKALEKTEIAKRDSRNKSLPMEERKEAYRDFVKLTKDFRNEHRKVNVRARNTPYISSPEFTGDQIRARVGYMSFGKQSFFPERLLTTAPEGQRMGILTQPSWLVSHSDAMDNHAIHRGIWIRKRLLGGGIPDVPITVDAQLPDKPNTTLRSRMHVTREEYCWSCHQKMDPLGLSFEMYNHIGMFRQEEQGEPVDTSGEIIDSGDPNLDGPVTDALDLITKLANSERAEQVFVRHAFRYWMGRNETLHDRPVLQAAHKAYRKNGGSMNALITSLVTSDAFLYRK